MNTQSLAGSTVLIVDDEPSARDVLQALLTADGYTIVQVTSGPEALARLEQAPPDAILLDVMMPGMDGFATCARIRAEPRWRQIPIIMVTALDQKEHLLRGLEAGADEFLSKPVLGAELRARVRTALRLKKQYDELKEMLRLREEMARMIVHDMRTPLTIIAVYSEMLLQEQTLPPAELEEVGIILEQAQRVNAFIEDLLLMSKLSHGKLILNREPTDANAVLQAIVKQQAIIAAKKGIAIALDVPPGDAPKVTLDAMLFRRVIDNLLGNAVKYAPEGTTVTVGAEYPPPAAGAPARCRVRIGDLGPGIPEEHWPRIFQEFETVQLRKKGVAQTGLGLHFCKLVTDAHGGTIRVGANHPHGSVFTVEL